MFLSGNKIMSMLKEKGACMVSVEAIESIAGVIYSDLEDYNRESPIPSYKNQKMYYEESDLSLHTCFCYNSVGEEGITVGVSHESIDGYIEDGILYLVCL